MARPIKRITAAPEVVAELERRSRATSVEVLVKERASIVLLRLEGQGVAAVAARLGTTPKRVSMWTKRFETKGLSGLDDAPGRGRKPSIPPEKIERVLTEAARAAPALERAQHGTPRRRLALHCSADLVEERLEASRDPDLELANDPRFEAKFWDVIGLYLDPLRPGGEQGRLDKSAGQQAREAEKALVLCCDEKSQCRALVNWPWSARNSGCRWRPSDPPP